MPRIDRFIRFNRENGKYVPNVDYRYLIPYKLTVDPHAVLTPGDPLVLPITIPLDSAIPSVPTILSVPNNAWGGADTNGLDTPFKVTQFLAEDVTAGGTGALFPTLYLKNLNGRDYMNAPIPLDLLGGDARLVGKLIEPMFLESTERLLASWSNPVALGNAGTVSTNFFMSGIQYYPGGLKANDPTDRLSNKLISYLNKFRKRAKQVYPFWFTTDAPVTLSANQTLSFITKLSTAHFESFTFLSHATGVYAIEITNVLTGQTLMNGRITNESSLGNARIPTILPVPYFLQDGSILRWTIQDLSGATNTVFPVLQGRKIIAPIQDVEKVTQEIDDVITPADMHAENNAEGVHEHMAEYFEEVL